MHPLPRSRFPLLLLPATALLAFGALLLAPAPARPDDPRLAISERGSGEPTLVLIHGLGLDRTLWSRVVPRLEPHHRVLLVDLPGHGASDPLPAVSVRAVAEALERTLRDRKVERAVLVGHSYGGLVALEEAVAHPKRARAVVTVDIGTYIPVDSTRIANLEQMIAKQYRLFVRAVFGTMTRDSSMVDSVVAQAERIVSPVLADYFRDAWRTDLRPRIRSMKQPILVLPTELLWPPAEPWERARTRLGYETSGPVTGRRIWGASHLVPIDQPDTLAAAILEFAAKLPK